MRDQFRPKDTGRDFTSYLSRPKLLTQGTNYVEAPTGSYIDRERNNTLPDAAELR